MRSHASQAASAVGNNAFPANERSSAAELAARIDHTNLKPEATRDEIVQLCAEARAFRFFSVCVQPIWVSVAERELRGTQVAVCTVVGFPSGAVPVPVKCAEAELAIRKGARELDMVVPVGLLRQGELDYVKAEIAELAGICHRGDALLKVILETAALNDTEVALGCALARLAGADFVKTSTGFHPSGGATEDRVRLMRQVVGTDLGVKAAGGIRTAEAALGMMAAGASRIGASSSVGMMEELAR
ncbi:MAG: deoxyribose-phosphate aldolase [Bryobacterales bacterium]|nr:deoxyribose-phosphate aldolase [Bryobacterales bacterium]